MNTKTPFFRNCPQCNSTLFYKSKKGLKVAIKYNRICKVCSNTGENNNNFGKPCPQHIKDILSKLHTGRLVSKKTRKKRSESLMGEKNPMFGLTGSLSPNFGKNLSDEHKLKLHNSKVGIPLSQYHREKISESLTGRTHSKETKLKMRLSKIKYIVEKNGSIAPRYNKRACLYFDLLETEKKWDGLYASKNGEFFIDTLGYWVDYYEPNLNIIIEYDEKKHYNVDGTLKKKDVERMNIIIQRLNCKFFRYNELLKELKEYN